MRLKQKHGYKIEPENMTDEEADNYGSLSLNFPMN